MLQRDLYAGARQPLPFQCVNPGTLDGRYSSDGRDYYASNGKPQFGYQDVLSVTHQITSI